MNRIRADKSSDGRAVKVGKAGAETIARNNANGRARVEDAVRVILRHIG